MKTTIITLVITLFAALGMQAQRGMDAFEVQVDGLGCPFCAYGLEKKFKEFKGIKKVKIDIESGDFSFLYPAEKALTMAAVVAQVEKAGYTPITSKIIRANGDVEMSEKMETVISDASKVVKEKVLVAGKCGMCEARIINTTKGIEGVTNAMWNIETQLLEVSFDQKQTSKDAIQKRVADAGHDTKPYKATAEGYKNLPACCKYTRLEQ